MPFIVHSVSSGKNEIVVAEFAQRPELSVRGLADTKGKLRALDFLQSSLRAPKNENLEALNAPPTKTFFGKN